MRAIRIVFSLLISSFFVLLATPVAWADTVDCGQEIVDKTSQQVLSKGIDDVRSAVAKVESFGADVYVRAYQQLPYNTGENYWSEGLRQCSNWRSSDPNSINVKSNVILILFSLEGVNGYDRQAHIFFNKAKYPSLESNWSSIRNNEMIPAFKDGNFTRGVSDTLNAVATDIDPNKPVPVQYDPTPLFKWAGIIIGSIIALVVSFFGLRLLIRWIVARRKAENARQNARADARTAKATASKRITDSRSSADFEAEYKVAIGNMPEVMAAKHRKAYSAINSSGEQAELFINLNSDPATDVSRELNTEVYRTLERKYNSIAEKLQVIFDAQTQLLEDIKSDQAALTPNGRMAHCQELNNRLNNVESVLTKCSHEFDVSEYSTRANVLLAELTTAQSQLEEANAVSSYEELNRVEKAIEELEREVDTLSSDLNRIVNANKLIESAINSRRQMLENLEHVDASSALADLRKVENSVGSFIVRLMPDKSRSSKLKSIDGFIDKINQIGQRAVSKNEKEEEKKRQERIAERKKASRSSSSSSSRSSSSNDGFAGGVLGGYIGGSIGSSSSHSTPSYSPPSYDSGGGGGGWGGGGGFDGGGGGGGW